MKWGGERESERETQGEKDNDPLAQTGGSSKCVRQEKKLPSYGPNMGHMDSRIFGGQNHQHLLRVRMVCWHASTKDGLGSHRFRERHLSQLR